ncbi:MAG: cytochrome o ubiquinol oxidase subunit IV [Chlamydiales bacterium]|nr:cytochrome o ubiquinol oxidase subunit IV [Chlamydiales bacterium]
MKEHEQEEEWEGSLSSYWIGYGLSLFFTLTAFYLVWAKKVDGPSFILVLALAQFVTQLIFFLHLGQESKKHWNLILFGFMLLVVAIVVLGTLWIMFGLKHRVMPWMH